MINGSFLNYLRSKGLIGSSKPIISEFQVRHGVEAHKSWTLSITAEDFKLVGDLFSYDDYYENEEEYDDSHEEEYIKFEGFEDEEELENWTSWANRMAIQEEGGEERGTGSGSEYDL